MAQYSLIFWEYLIFCIFPYKRTPNVAMKSLRICFIIWVQVKGTYVIVDPTVATYVSSIKHGPFGFKASDLRQWL